LKHTVPVITDSQAPQTYFSIPLGHEALLARNLRTKTGRRLGLGSIPKMLRHPIISATIEASNFKFGTKLGFGE